jgi:hypothetical protein
MGIGTIWTAVEDLAPPNGVRNPNRPASSELLYQLYYTDYHMLSVLMEMIWSFLTTGIPVWITLKLFKIKPLQWNILFPEQEQVPHSKLGGKNRRSKSIGKGRGWLQWILPEVLCGKAHSFCETGTSGKRWSFSCAKVNFPELLSKMAVCPFWGKKFANRKKQFLYLGVLTRF